MTYKIKMTGMILISLFAIIGMLVALVAYANPVFFAPTAQSGSATTDVVYMTPGRATTTVTLNHRGNTMFGAKELALLIQEAGSSTSATVNFDVQYSPNCAADGTGGDWYAASLGWNLEQGGVASTSPSLGATQQHTLQFASSTITRGVVTNANSATTTRIARLMAPTQCTRVIATMPTGSAGAAVWFQLAPLKENNQ